MPVETLVEALSLTPTGPGSFRAENDIRGERGVVFGGQLIAQLLVAGATADPSKSVKSAHALFARPVMVDEDVELRVDVLQKGRTFASVSTSLWQADKERARAMVLLSADEPDLIRHQTPMPEVPGPDTLALGYRDEDIRIVGGVDINDATTVGEPSLQIWTRYLDAGTDPAVGQGLVAYTSASLLIGTAMRPHEGVGQSAAHAAFSTGIIGHTISFHEPFDAREWLLLDHTSTFAGRGRAYGTGEIFRSDGRLVASYSQEGMIRHFPDGVSPEGQESTIL
jgi:acyl-CoA thioesterase-2